MGLTDVSGARFMSAGELGWLIIHTIMMLYDPVLRPLDCRRYVHVTVRQ